MSKIDGSKDHKAGRLIGMKEILRRVPFSRAHIHRLERAKRFPLRVKVGARRVGWHEEELEAWLAALPRATHTASDDT